MENHNESTHEVERLKCIQSFEYFCENYLKITNYNNPILEELIPFKLFDYQKRLIRKIEENRFVIAKKFRCGGFTTLIAAYLTWRLLFKSHEHNAIICMSDRVAIYCNTIVRRCIGNLPNFLKPELGVPNDHSLVHDEIQSKLSFLTPEGTCGLSLKFVFLDEPAFITNMSSHWKTIEPDISANGHCIAISTPKSAESWFYETYKSALHGKNHFKPFCCDYTEHPRYQDVEWLEKTKKTLGENIWRQEILQEFTYEKPNTVDESVNKMALDGEIQDDSKVSEAVIPEQSEEESPEILLNVSDKVSGDAYIEIHKQKQEIYTFQPMTLEEQERLVKSHQENACNVKGHPHFDNFHFKNYNDLTKFYKEICEIFPECEDVYSNWITESERLQKEAEELEFRANIGLTAELLLMAGVIEEKDLDNVEVRAWSTTPGETILKKVESNFEEINLSFKDGKLSVNGAITCILEDDLRDLYNGLFGLRSYREAMDTCVAVVVEKLSPLFQKRG